MLISSKIRILLSERSMTLKSLAGLLNMSEMGLNKMLSNESFKVETLVKIAEVLKVPMLYFFLDVTEVKENNFAADVPETYRKIFTADISAINLLYKTYIIDKSDMFGLDGGFADFNFVTVMQKYSLLNDSDFDNLIKHGIFNETTVKKIKELLEAGKSQF